MGNGVASRQVTSNEKGVAGATKERTGSMGNGVASRQITSNEKSVVGATKERTGNMGNGVVIDLHKYTGHALERMITKWKRSA